MRAIRSGWLAWALWGLAMLVLAAAAWLDHLLRRAGRPDLTVFDAAALAVEVAHAGLVTIGAVVAFAALWLAPDLGRRRNDTDGRYPPR